MNTPDPMLPLRIKRQMTPSQQPTIDKDALIRELADRLEQLHEVSGESVELSDWPELQYARDLASEALSRIPAELKGDK